ncbi:hypothetical protein V1512DRAFT_243212 [Lipomyces arxii]|uniref:uncharacterized protein n=1 Tax=Lipomyces arxii TaxID=56418 RepID=UPI0034CF7F31
MTTVAIAGTNGFLFKPVAEGLTSDLFHGKYKLPIKALTRDPSKNAPIEGIEFVKTDYDDAESLAETLKGVDVVINILGFNPALWNKLADAADAAGVKTYFCSDFGSDYRYLLLIYEVLTPKAIHADYARTKSFKTIQSANGLFMPFWSYGFFGHDFKNGTATFFGDGTQDVATTDLKDIGLSVASVAYRDDIPEYLLIRGDHMTLNESVALYEKVTGKKMTVSYVGTPSLEPIAADDFDPIEGLKTLSAHPETLTFALRGDDNEYINPGLWKWKTLADEFKTFA